MSAPDEERLAEETAAGASTGWIVKCRPRAPIALLDVPVKADFGSSLTRGQTTAAPSGVHGRRLHTECLAQYRPVLFRTSGFA